MSDVQMKIINSKSKVSDSSSDSDSDTDVDSVDEAQNTILETRSNTLKAELDQNPYVYDTYVELVRIYEQLADWDNLKITLEQFSNHFPLTEDFWLLWIENEIKLMPKDSVDAKNYICSLFEKAVEDYLSVNVWLEYILFAMDNFAANETRNLFKRSMEVAGCHFIKGSLLWDAFRDFEMRILSMLEDKTEFKNQIEVIGRIFHEQLSIPLKTTNFTYGELINWKEEIDSCVENATVISADLEPIYRSTTSLMTKWQLFETQLNDADSESKKFQIYCKYLQNVQEDIKAKSLKAYKSIIRCLFERMVTDLCLHSDAWIKYLDWIRFEVDENSEKLLLSVVKRSVRNCLWNGSMWSYYIQILEFLNHSHDEVTKCFEDALNTGLSNGGMYIEVWMAYIEYFRRITDKNNPDSLNKFKSILEKGVDFLQPYDHQCKFLRFFAWTHAEFFQDLAAMRQIFTGILRHDYNGSKYEFWTELISLEKQYGDEKHQRKTWQRALNNVKDWPQLIAEQWLDFERKCGTISSFLACQRSIRNCKALQPTEVITTTKRKRTDASTNENTKSTKKPKFEPKNVNTFQNVDVKPLSNSSNEICTVFVKGLPKDSTKQSINDLFEQCGTPISIRTIPDKMGKLKNFAYIDFEKKAEADNAIRMLNGYDVGNDKKLFVAYSDPPKRNELQNQAGGLSSNRRKILKPKLSVDLIPKVIQHQKDNGITVKKTEMSNDDFRKAFLQTK